MSRTQVVSDVGLLVEYPDAVQFAFSPAIIKLVTIGKRNNGFISIKVAGDGKEYTERRELPDSNSGYGLPAIDISSLLQIAFGDLGEYFEYGTLFMSDNLMKTFSLRMDFIGDSGSTTLVDDSITVIWGARELEQDTAGTHRVPWWMWYPFTLSFFGDPSVSMMVQTPGGSFEGAESALSIFNLRSEPYIVQAISSTTMEYGGLEPIAKTTVYMLDTCNDTDGVYIRWIDNLGRYCYWLLKESGSSTEMEVERWNRYLAPGYGQSQRIDTDVRQSFTKKTYRSLGARLLDREQMQWLMTLAASPVVDVFDGYLIDGVIVSASDAKDWVNSRTDLAKYSTIWHRVNVVASKIDISTADLQDFSITIEEPEQKTQRL